jgi:hypothetical protein
MLLGPTVLYCSFLHDLRYMEGSMPIHRMARNENFKFACDHICFFQFSELLSNALLVLVLISL